MSAAKMLSVFFFFLSLLYHLFTDSMKFKFDIKLIFVILILNFLMCVNIWSSIDTGNESFCLLSENPDILKMLPIWKSHIDIKKRKKKIIVLYQKD